MILILDFALSKIEIKFILNPVLRKAITNTHIYNQIIIMIITQYINTYVFIYMESLIFTNKLKRSPNIYIYYIKRGEY